MGVLAQHEAMTARELAGVLELSSVGALHPWIRRLLDWNLVKRAGRTQATRYFVEPGVLRDLSFVGSTTLKRIEPHRLVALIVEYVERYPQSKIGEIHERIGQEIPRSRIRRSIGRLVESGRLVAEGVKNGTRYRLP